MIEYLPLLLIPDRVLLRSLDLFLQPFLGILNYSLELLLCFEVVLIVSLDAFL